MSSALTLIVFGQVYLAGNSSLIPHTPIDSVSSVNLPGLQYTLQPTPAAQVSEFRSDYTYTPGIGAHKLHILAATWREARRHCRSEGGDLAVINSEAESKLLGKLIVASQSHIGTTHSDYALIGFHDLIDEGVHETVKGQTLLEAGFDSWYSGEPNDGNGGGSGDDCGSVRIDGRLNDAACDSRYAYICELPYPTQVPPISMVEIEQQSEPVIQLLETTTAAKSEATTADTITFEEDSNAVWTNTESTLIDAQ